MSTVVRHLRPNARAYATAVSGAPKAPLSGLSDAVRARAEQLSQWKGTSATGENTRNYIGGEFVESKAEQWIDVVDPVRTIANLSMCMLAH
jgi:malonate-semialdehyde dehydrogenase (acetylating)/methylmalonate-semialdehyde dehydrogenase